MKKCPYCAEEIQDEAIKCKHCGSDLTSSATPPPPPAPIAEVPPVTPKKKTSPLAKGCLVLILLFAAFLIIPQICGHSLREPKPATSESAKSTPKNTSTTEANSNPCWPRTAQTIFQDSNDFRSRKLFGLAKDGYQKLIQCAPSSAEAQEAKKILTVLEQEQKTKEAKEEKAFEVKSENIAISVTSQIVKKIGNDHRYFFDIRNSDKNYFDGIVTIKLFRRDGQWIGGDESFRGTISAGTGRSVYIDRRTGPESVHGEFGIAKYKYEAKINEKVVNTGEGEISEKYEDLSEF